MWRRRGSKGLRKGRRPRVRVRLKEYKAAGYLKKRMMMMAFRMSRQPRGRASRRRKRREIKVRALLRRHRGLQRQRKQARQRQVWVWKPNHGLHPFRQMSSKQLASFLVQQPLVRERNCLWPSSTYRVQIHHQEKLRRLVPALLWGQQQCQKKHQHQQKACRELRQQQQGRGPITRISICQ